MFLLVQSNRHIIVETMVYITLKVRWCLVQHFTSCILFLWERISLLIKINDIAKLSFLCCVINILIYASFGEINVTFPLDKVVLYDVVFGVIGLYICLIFFLDMVVQILRR